MTAPKQDTSATKPHVEPPHLIEFSKVLDELHKLQVSALVPQPDKEQIQALVYARTTDTISLALAQFRNHNIISLPIFDTIKGKFVTMINVVDVMRFMMLREFYKIDPSYKEELTKLYECKMEDVIAAVVLNRPFRVYHVTDPLFVALRAMEAGNENVYGILVSFAEDKEQIESDIKHALIITQWDAINFLLRNDVVRRHGKLDTLPAKQVMQRAWITFTKNDDPNQPTHRLPITPGRSTFALSVLKDVSAFSALRSMSAHHISSIAVVEKDAAGTIKLIDNLSASDIRFITVDNLADGFLEVTEFLSKVRGHPGKPILCDEETPLVQIMEMALKNNVHRVWIVEHSTGKPIGLCSMSDMLSVVVGVNA
ncbi:9871_t:CDS:2 [Ambispora gerdemannii]|uniref:9871_t:CDS:1 n=1 Tax=Ambispora gerdemannii TaxID=144530 RepID=A0A9N8YSX1_9GLOM|nr:9871_t:CDS:2 [Ambispora gerdemannii]